MNIDSITNGVVIDHITAGRAMELYDLLNLDRMDCQVAIIMNALSRKTGKKGKDLVIRVPRGTVIKEAESGAVMADISSDEPFVIGKVYNMNPGTDVTLIATGHTVWEAIQAAEALEAEGISAEVLNIATVKPLDTAAILESVSKTGAAVVAEEHNVAGGLGEAVAAVLAANAPAPVEFINGGDRFGQSGTPAELMAAYGLDAAHIAAAARKAISRK